MPRTFYPVLSTLNLLGFNYIAEITEVNCLAFNEKDSGYTTNGALGKSSRLGSTGKEYEPQTNKPHA